MWTVVPKRPICYLPNILGSSSCRSASSVSNAPKPNLAELWIDDKRVEVEPGTTILEAAVKVGVEIPRFCYHERLSVAGNCRMCLVEVEKSVKPVASCAMPVMNGMRVHTQSEKARKAREGVMEFLLQNHPLDCPICDQGGECDLQDQAMTFGSDKSRLQIDHDGKRAVEDKNVGPLIKTIMTRCIQCTRCVRFMNEIAGVSELGTYNRGNDLQIGTYLSDTLLKTELSGNIVDICPVGALTAKPYTFVARPWELRRFDSVDVFDAVGSNISICQRANDLLRILPRPNDDINEEWLADKSRHAAVDGLKTQRITMPMLRPSREENLKISSWQDGLVTLGEHFNRVSKKPDNLEVIVGPMVDLETMVAVKDLFNSMNCDNVYVHYDSAIDPSSIPTHSDLDFRNNYLFNTTIAGLEFDDIDYLLIVGSNPRFEAPLLNARIRKAWRNHNLNRISLIGPKDMDLLYDYEFLGDSVDVIQKIIDGKHPAAKELKSAKNAAIIFGQQLKGSEAGEPGSLYKLVRGMADKYKAKFNVLTGSASHNAALDMGFKPTTERRINENSESGLTWLIGVDDGDLLVPKSSFVVYQGHNGDIGAELADLVLPGFAYTEKQATYVNMEGRVQQTLAAVSPMNTLAREDWKIVRAVSELVDKTLPYDSLQELRERVRDLAPHLVRHSYLRIEPSTLVDPRRRVNVDVKLNAKAKLEPRLLSMAQYYQTDAISRNSKTMAKCVDAVVNGI
uniref:NADH-ubiquinone oxidoreductase 75 kDa subunit, mitochondrial n=1 Tax=Aceria tosichella TaxID=561515 RepID=A0A6G1SP79_9ACAR